MVRITYGFDFVQDFYEIPAIHQFTPILNYLRKM